MKTIKISDEAFSRLSLAAAVAGVSVDVAVDRLLELRLPGGIVDDEQARAAAWSADAEPQERLVHASYRGTRVEGVLDVVTGKLTVTNGPEDALGEFANPSAAAMAIVGVLNPDRKRTETNGWKFWRGPDGRPIQQFRR